MSNIKFTDLSADTSPQNTDIVATARSPFGAGSNRKVTLANAIQKGHGLTASTIATVTSAGLLEGTVKFSWNETTQTAKLGQIGANATGYADQRSSGILNFESGQWTGSAATTGNWSFQGITSTTANVNNFTLKYGTTSYFNVDSRQFITFSLSVATLSYAASSTAAPSAGVRYAVKNTDSTANNFGTFHNQNANGMNTGSLAFKNTSHHATTGSADFELWLANGAAAAKVFGVTSAGLMTATSATLGAASTDVITHTGRCVLRTLGSDPQHVTPGSRPAGTVAEIAYYNGKMYFCTSAATPTWELITSA